MKLYFSLIVLAVIAITSCSKSDCEDGFSTTKFKLAKEYCLKDKETIIIDSLEDSRCPSNVECVWEGEVKIYLSLDINNEKHKHTLIFKNDDTEQSFEDVNGYELKIKSITPYPSAPSDIPQEDYVIEMGIK